LDGFILDIRLPSRPVIVEIDGAQHAEEPNRARDGARDAHFAKSGYETLRSGITRFDQRLDELAEGISGWPWSGSKRYPD
jgi:very-short-patch-repair endonuclease